MKFHDKLCRMMENMNQSAVSRSAGISQATLNGLLRRKASPNLQTAVKVAKALDVDIGWFLDDAQEWPPVRLESEQVLQPA